MGNCQALVRVAGWLTVPFTKIRKYRSFVLPEALSDLWVTPLLTALASHGNSASVAHSDPLLPGGVDPARSPKGGNQEEIPTGRGITMGHKSTNPPNCHPDTLPEVSK